MREPSEQAPLGIDVTPPPTLPFGVADGAGGRPSFVAPRVVWPALANEVSDDFRDFLPVGSPFSARDYVDALEEEGGAVSFRGLAFNLCRAGSPLAASVEFVDDFGLARELMIWTYQSSEEVQHDWSFEQPAARRVVPRGTGCPTGALLAERVAGAAWAVENIVVAIPTSSFPGGASEEELLSVLESLSETDELEPRGNPQLTMFGRGADTDGTMQSATSSLLSMQAAVRRGLLLLVLVLR